MEACLAWINLNSTELAPRYYIISRRGYTNKGWKKLDSSEEFILKTYDLTLQNNKNAWCFPTIVYPIQIIEQVHFNHTDGRLFTEAVLNRFDLRESQNAIYKNNMCFCQHTMQYLCTYKNFLQILIDTDNVQQ